MTTPIIPLQRRAISSEAQKRGGIYIDSTWAFPDGKALRIFYNMRHQESKNIVSWYDKSKNGGFLFGNEKICDFGQTNQTEAGSA